jgi:hypothetical protein
VFSAGVPQESQSLKTPPSQPAATSGQSIQYVTLLKLFILNEFDIRCCRQGNQNVNLSDEPPNRKSNLGIS